MTPPAAHGRAKPRGAARESRDGPRRKAAILEVAAGIFARSGYRDASLASIAEAAGLTQQGVLHHFSSKAALLLALLEERERGDRAAVQAALEEHPRDIVRALKKLVSQNVKTRDDTWLFTVLSAEATAPEHPAHDYFVARYSRVRTVLTRSMVNELPRATPRRKAEIEALAPIIVATMDGLQLQWLLDPTFDMESHFQFFSSFIERVVNDTMRSTHANGKASGQSRNSRSR